MPVLWMGQGQVTYGLNKRGAACPSRQERYLPVRRHFSSDIRLGGNTLAVPFPTAIMFVLQRAFSSTLDWS